MKKFLLATVCLMVSLLGMAQSTKDTAKDLVIGTNSETFTQNDDVNIVYYKYTAPEGDGQMVTLTISNYNPSVSAEKEDGTSVSVISYSSAKRAIPVEGGTTVYIKAACYQLNYSFEAEVSECDLAHGASCDDPVIASDNVLLLAPHRQNPDETTASDFFAYEPTEDGVLEIYVYNYANTFMVHEGCDDTGTDVTLSYDGATGSNKGKMQVEAGKRYIFEIASYYGNMLTFALTHPVEGSSCDMPFTASSSEPNTLPAAAGTYWYKFTSDKTGFAFMASDSSLPSGTVSAYNSCSSSYALASVSGCMKLRASVTAGAAIYICIEKAETTEADETFTITVKDAEAGDTSDNPRELIWGENVTPEYNGDYYYTFTVPEGSSKMLKIDASKAGISNYNTKVALYQSASSWSALAYDQSSLSYEVMGGSSYLLKWTLSEGTNGFSFDAALEDIKQGDTAGNPLEAVLGDNALESGSVKYYYYVATKTAWLSIDVDPTVTVEFPEDPTNSWSGNYTAQVNGTVSRIKATEGTKYYLKFTGIAEDTSFTLSEDDFKQGESKSYPFEITEDETSLPNEAIDYWYVYTAPRAGKLVVSSDIAYETNYNTYDTSNVTVAINDGPDNNISQYDNETYEILYKANFDVKEGDVAYINVHTPYAQEGRTLTCKVVDYEQGETSSNPLPLNEGETALPLVNQSNPRWYSVTLEKNDTLIVNASDYFMGTLYLASDLTNEVQSMQYDVDEETGEYSFFLNYVSQEEGKNEYLLLVELTYSSDVTIDVKIHKALVDGIDGISSVAENGKLNIYDLQGRKIFSDNAENGISLKRGIYLVNGRKVVIK